MRDYVDLGVTTPPEEDCAQVGSKSYDYYDRARREARALINQLRRAFGPEPPGASLSLKSHPHDFGSYLTVVCYYEQQDPLAADYARRCDEQCPREWDEQARAESTIHRPNHSERK
jgi:hypothetical protein